MALKSVATHLCEYLTELYEAAENENEYGVEKKKNFRRHASKECEQHLLIYNRGMLKESKISVRNHQVVQICMKIKSKHFRWFKN